MRSDDEDDEDDSDEENEEDEQQIPDSQVNGRNGHVDDEDDASDDDGDSDDDDVEGEDDDDDDDEDEDDDEEEEDDEDDHSDDDEAEDVDMSATGDPASSPQQSQKSRQSSDRSKTPTNLPIPPHLVRRSLLQPSFTQAPSSLSIEAIVAIPLPSPVHALAATTCLSYLLAGSQDGHVRAYDFWPSVNGAQLMSAPQRSVVGLGESVSKTGVVRGWWSSEVDDLRDGGMERKLEPVYSMACEGDGVWALTGTRSGPINLFSLRHSPGHRIHSLKGHTSVVSCMTLLPGERSFISGSWDGTVREWDLNTGQTVRAYPTHGAQLSSLALRPLTQSSASPLNGHMERGTSQRSVSIIAGPDLTGPSSSDAPPTLTSSPPKEPDPPPVPDGDIVMSEPSPYDPLFDEDAEGESILPSGEITTLNGTPNPSAQSNQPQPPPPQLPTSQPDGPLFSTPQKTSPRQAASGIPILKHDTFTTFSPEILLTSSMDGQVSLLDRRVPSTVGRLIPGERAPPWCMSAIWSGDGNQVLAGRRNGTVDIWDVRQTSSTSPNLLRTLKTPAESGPISCLVAMPDGRHVVTASQDNLRLWNTAEYFEPVEEESGRKSRSKPPFKIIAGHHGGTVSSMLVDPTQRFLITASGDRGWTGESTRVVLVHEIKW